MTAFALRMTRFHNGVSKKHGEVAREMWQPLWPDLPPEKVPIDAITNGVHVPTWLNHRIEALIDRYMDPIYRTGGRITTTRSSGRLSMRSRTKNSGASTSG